MIRRRSESPGRGTGMQSPVSCEIRLRMLPREHLFELGRAVGISMLGQNALQGRLADGLGSFWIEGGEMFRDFPTILRHEHLAFRFEKHFNSLPLIGDQAGTSARCL